MYSFIVIDRMNLMEQMIEADRRIGALTFERLRFILRHNYTTQNTKWIMAQGDIQRFFS